MLAFRSVVSVLVRGLMPAILGKRWQCWVVDL